MELNRQQLQALATNHLQTKDANYVLQPNQVFDFRGVLVSTLVKKFGAATDVTDITFGYFK